MINAGYATLDQRPKVLDVVGVNLTSDVDFSTMLDSLMLVAEPCYMVIAWKLVGVKNCIGRYVFDYERNEGRPFNVRNGCSHNSALPLNDANDGDLAFCSSTPLAMPDTANIGLINLDFASEDRIGFAEQCPDLLEHSPSGFVGDTSFPLNLFGGDSASGRSHPVYDLKPSPKWCSRFVEYSPRSWVNLMVAIITVIACAIGKFVVFSHSLANWTLNAVRPAMVLNPFKASIVIWESLVKVSDSKFVHSWYRFFVYHFIPHLQVLYHTSYLLSRDSCLILLGSFKGTSVFIVT